MGRGGVGVVGRPGTSFPILQSRSKHILFHELSDRWAAVVVLFEVDESIFRLQLGIRNDIAVLAWSL